MKMQSQAHSFQLPLYSALAVCDRCSLNFSKCLSGALYLQQLSSRSPKDLVLGGTWRWILTLICQNPAVVTCATQRRQCQAQPTWLCAFWPWPSFCCSVLPLCAFLLGVLSAPSRSGMALYGALSPAVLFCSFLFRHLCSCGLPSCSSVLYLLTYSF